MSKHSADSGYLAIGLDVGDRFCHFCVVDATGEIVEEGRMATTPKALGLGFASRPRARVALEVGTHSPWISRLLAEFSLSKEVDGPGWGSGSRLVRGGG